MNHLYYGDNRMEQLKPRMKPTPLLLAAVVAGWRLLICER